MAKKEKDNVQIDNQTMLIDVGPKKAAPLIKQARLYKQWQKERLAAGNMEVTAKKKLLAMIQESGLKRLDDGSIRASLDGFVIEVTPRDELITVTEGE